MTTYVLYGATDRDPDKELVCQFFATIEDREAFAADLPGRYERMALQGIDYNDIDVTVEGYDNDVTYYHTDPNDPEAPILLSEYNGLRPGDSVAYDNPAAPSIDGPLVLSALYRMDEDFVTAILNDGEWEVSADNLKGITS